jgi:hypothetical protein
MAIKHTKVVTLPNDPTQEVSADAWNDGHTIEAGTITNTEISNSAGIVESKLALNYPTRPSSIDVTYVELLALSAAGSLVRGQKYRLTDFRTRHTIPGTTVINEGNIEVIVLTGLTINSFEPIVYSESFPDDIIKYTISNTWLYKRSDSLVDSAVDRGFIYERITKNGVMTPFDSRAVKYRTWDIDGTLNFISPVETAFTYIDTLTFKLVGAIDTMVENITMLQFSTLFEPYLPNTVFNLSEIASVKNVHFNTVINGIRCSDHFDNITVNGGGMTNFCCLDARDVIFNSNVNNVYFGSIQTCWFKQLENITNFPTFLNVHAIDKITGDNVSTTFNSINGTQFKSRFACGGSNLSDTPFSASTQFDNNVFSLNIGNTIADTFDITGLTTLDNTGKDCAGILILTSTNATEVIDTITLFDTVSIYREYKLMPAAGLTVTITTGGRGSVALNGTNGDSCIVYYDTLLGAIRMKTPDTFS